MKVKCYQCKEYFSSGECVRQSSGSRRYGGTISNVWLCYPCQEKEQKEIEENNKRFLKKVSIILLIIFGVWLAIAVFVNILNKINRFKLI